MNVKHTYKALNMSSTLKELCVQKQLLEALDQQKLQQMVQTIGSLETMIAPIRNKVPQLSQAINQAKEMAAQKMSGEGGVWKKLAQNVNDKYKIVDELKDFITFQASMLQGFRSMPQVIALLKKMNIDPQAKGGSSDEPLSKAFANSPQNRTQIVKVLQNAFSPPSGIFSSKKLPFVKDVGMMATEFFNLSPNEIEQLANRSKSAPGLPISSQDAKLISNQNPQQAANQMAAGAEQQTTGKDASGKSVGVQGSQAQQTGPGTAQPSQGGAPAGQPGQTARTRKGSGGSTTPKTLPDFQTAMAAVGAKNLNDPANKKTVDTFKRFYDYLIKNAK
jgi:hypothetical protein